MLMQIICNSYYNSPIQNIKPLYSSSILLFPSPLKFRFTAGENGDKTNSLMYNFGIPQSLKAAEIEGYNYLNLNREVAILNNILYQVSKPARYTGGEWNSIAKDWQATPIRVALAFPDIYEIGASNLALPILYQILNNQPDVIAERVYAPWVDMEALLRQHDTPLFSLETKHPLRDFDIIGFSLGYELSYTNVLNMLDLAQIPLLGHQRSASYPLIIAGGSCALNPEPMTDFIDLFVIGEAEETILELIEILRACKTNKRDRKSVV